MCIDTPTRELTLKLQVFVPLIHGCSDRKDFGLIYVLLLHNANHTLTFLSCITCDVLLQ